MELKILELIGIILGIILAAWGLFHQLIVKSTVSLLHTVSPKNVRIVVMSWVAQGAYMSFTGILSSVILILYQIDLPVVHLILFMCSFAMLFLAGHVLITGFRAHMKPIRIGAFIEIIYGVYMIVLVTIRS